MPFSRSERRASAAQGPIVFSVEGCSHASRLAMPSFGASRPSRMPLSSQRTRPALTLTTASPSRSRLSYFRTPSETSAAPMLLRQLGYCSLSLSFYAPFFVLSHMPRMMMVRLFDMVMRKMNYESLCTVLSIRCSTHFRSYLFPRPSPVRSTRWLMPYRSKARRKLKIRGRRLLERPSRSASIELFILLLLLYLAPVTQVYNYAGCFQQVERFAEGRYGRCEEAD